MYNISQFAQKVGVAVKTLQRWDREGRLIARRTLTNRRYYADEDLAIALGHPAPKKALADDQSTQDPAEPPQDERQGEPCPLRDCMHPAGLAAQTYH